MHELGVVFHIADIVRDVAVENKATKIQKVVMQIGEVSTVVNDQLIDCWNWNRTAKTARKNTKRSNTAKSARIAKAKGLIF